MSDIFICEIEKLEKQGVKVIKIEKEYRKNGEKHTTIELTSELDFSEHDKVFEDKITELKKDYKTASELLGKYQQDNESLKQRIAELESMEMEKPTKLNLNERVKVKLTPLGAEIYYHQYDEVNKRIKENGGTELEPIMPQIDKDGYTEFQLWHFIELYGEHIGMCKPNVINPLGIIIVE